MSGIRLSGPSLLRLRPILHFVGALPLGFSLRIPRDLEDAEPLFVDRGIQRAFASAYGICAGDVNPKQAAFTIKR